MVEGYVLHSVPWRETSLIAEVFTRDEGRVGLVARGARRPRSALRGLLQPFQKLGLRYSHKGDLRTLMGAEWLGTQGCGMPSGASLMAGFYVNELLLRLLQRQDPHSDLFLAYEMVLDHLSGPAPTTEVCLRWFECRLLRGLGIAPDFTAGLDDSTVLHFQLAPGEPIGLSASEPEQGVLLDKETLETLARYDAYSELQECLRDGLKSNLAVKRALRLLLVHQLGSVPLFSREAAVDLHYLRDGVIS
ncbi:MAG: DNA repair protein RecO [Burkholderiaceae bacterium]